MNQHQYKGAGGATGIHLHLSLLIDNQLTICCGDTIFCLYLPDLHLKWQTKADMVTCFGIYKLQEEYVVHGEIEISRLAKDGHIKWSFSGSDIFVSFDEEAFMLKSDHIELTDFHKVKYKIDFDGNNIWTSSGQAETNNG